MKIKTEADEHLDKAKENIQEAIAELSAILMDQCVGWDEYAEPFRYIMFNALSQLKTIKDQLNQ
jgi:hypothetical protein